MTNYLPLSSVLILFAVCLFAAYFTIKAEQKAKAKNEENAGINISETQVAYCPYCGEKILDNSNFCHKCGNTIDLAYKLDSIGKKKRVNYCSIISLVLYILPFALPQLNYFPFLLAFLMPLVYLLAMILSVIGFVKALYGRYGLKWLSIMVFIVSVLLLVFIFVNSLYSA